MDAGEVPIVVATDTASVPTLQGLLTNATKSETKVGGNADEAQQALDAEG
jgi:hypothetical protein